MQGKNVLARSSRGERIRSTFGAADRVVKAGVVLAVCFVLLLAGFAGPSVYFVFPGRAGWIYIGVVITVAALFLRRILRRGGREEDQTRSAE